MISGIHIKPCFPIWEARYLVALIMFDYFGQSVGTAVIFDIYREYVIVNDQEEITAIYCWPQMDFVKCGMLRRNMLGEPLVKLYFCDTRNVCT